MRDTTAPAGRASGRQRGLRALWALLLVLAVQLSVVAAPAADATEGDGAGPVYVVDISGIIDLGLAPYLERVLGEAERAGAAAVVLEIDTPGGRLDAVLQMRAVLLDSPLPTIALVDSTAFSAGALIAIASEKIYMTPGAVMGAATPVLGGTGEVADEKTISAVRSTFESTAEERGRDPLVAGAMVDTEVEIDGLSERGRLLTLTVSQALDTGYAEGEVANLAALLDELGLADRELVQTTPSLAERLVRLITNPVTASLLLTIGVLLLLADLASGGVGVGLVVGLSLLTLFFWGHMLAGLAGWEDVALVVVGLGLIAVELLVVPGFGVPGVLGLLALLGGVFLARLNRDFDFVTTADLRRAGVTVAITFVAIAAGMMVLLALLARGAPRSRLVLQARLDVGAPVTERASYGWLRWFGGNDRLASDGPARPGVSSDGLSDGPARPERSSDGISDGPARPERSSDGLSDGPARPERSSDGPPAIGGWAPAPSRPDEPSLVGATGTALTDLRPAGLADIGGRRVDVVTEGGYLRSGEPVEVVQDDRYRRVVRRRDP